MVKYILHRSLIFVVVPVVCLVDVSSASRHLVGELELPPFVGYNVALDLYSAEDPIGLTSTYGNYGIGVQRLLAAEYPWAISRVMYGPTLVYDANMDEKHTIDYVMLTYGAEAVLIHISKVEGDLYFVMRGCSCIRVTAKEYYLTLAQLRFPAALDINIISSTEGVSASLEFRDRLPVVMYECKTEYRIDEVVDDGVRIWSKSGGGYCTSAALCYREPYFMLELSIEESDGMQRLNYIREADGLYTKISEEKYKELLTGSDTSTAVA